MSRDSNPTYIHMHDSRYADLFEEFCRSPSSNGPPGPTSNHNTTTQVNNGTVHISSNNNVNTGGAGGDPSMTQVPGHFLPFEEIQLPPHLMPINPEDEDDVVPDMHAAFSIDRALGQGSNGVAGGMRGEGSGAGMPREPAWRDLGLERLLDGLPRGSRTATTIKREGQKSGVLLRR